VTDPEPQRERKERVLHTRISQQLAEDISRMAEDLRVPVSNLVRNVLEEVFSVVETVTENVGDLVEDVMDEAERARERVRQTRLHGRHRRWHRHGPQHRHRSRHGADAGDAREDEPPRREDPASVVGWQPLILARAAVCADCAASLQRGERAYLGLETTGPGSLTLCADCLDARRQR
jgi:hypothetical protein